MSDGLQCLNCGCRHLPVKITNPTVGGKVRRVRECRNCDRRLVTYETVSEEKAVSRIK